MNRAGTPPRICIVGAGSSGLITAKVLTESGLAYDCFEKGSDIGGMWRYLNDNGASSCYRSLHIDTSIKNLAYSDFPFPPGSPDFPSHRDVLAYFEAFADRHALRDAISFGREVAEVAPADGRWQVRLADGEARRYDAVIVANGHLWKPRHPSFPGAFDGETLHAHDYKTPEPFIGKDVLVVGIGNSAVDIAVDVARVANSLCISTRRSAWVLPKYLLGVPIDRWGTVLAGKLRLPVPLSRAIVGKAARLIHGRQETFGLPRPAHPIWREHATLSQEMLPYLGHGWIKIRPNIAELRGPSVMFEDGRVERYDAIIHATGYRTEFPFLARDIFCVEDNKTVGLYRRMLPPDRPGLFFAGLVQPIGPTIPLVERQARWLAAVLGGRLRLPAPEAMRREIDRHHDKAARRYVGSPRYTLEVDFRSYAKQLAGDISTGKAGV
jgi:cation diffusion facilitator CzcD-associated flavoprotein CzcO